MSTNLDPLILDLIEWIAREPRTYAEVMDAWRTSCPRLTVWEDAVDRGLAARGQNGAVFVTTAGYAFLSADRSTFPVGASIHAAHGMT